MLYEERTLDLDCSISELRNALNVATAGLSVEKAEPPLLREKPEFAVRIRKRRLIPSSVGAVDVIAYKKDEDSCTVLLQPVWSSFKEKVAMGFLKDTSKMVQKGASLKLAKELEAAIKNGT